MFNGVDIFIERVERDFIGHYATLVVSMLNLSPKVSIILVRVHVLSRYQWRMSGFDSKTKMP